MAGFLVDFMSVWWYSILNKQKAIYNFHNKQTILKVIKQETMKNLNKNDVEFLVDCLKKGKEIPLEYKYAIFPTKQKEYELVYAGKMRKEDILADNEEAKAVPLQVEKIFNGKKYPLYSKDWHNLLVFGDNLQILKTFYKNEDPLIKNKVKGKVKLIYIDPPFATKSDFTGDKGQKAYSDKTKGAEFVEFLRKRLIIARELLADDGNIFVHLDWKKAHYIKLVLDEVFGESNFRNEIIWRYGKMANASKQFMKNHDSILFYSKTENAIFKNIKIALDEPIKRLAREVVDGKLKNARDEKGNIKYIYVTERTIDDVWSDISRTMPASTEFIDYPTQKPEQLIKRVIKATTAKGDLVMDFFCGSGTTLAVAEKLNRRWIGCDIGKLAIYTTQKRLLEIEQSKNLEDPKKKYNKPAKSFGVVASGLYDLGKIFNLKKDEYVDFVKRLFEIEEINKNKIGGVEIDGKKREFYTKIFPYWDFKNTSVDENYLRELHKSIGKKVDGRFYIIAPANNVDFISDYHQIDNVRYYFLKVPYQIIRELHRVQFKKLRQPQSKRNINDLDEAIGFHFIRQPEVKSEIKKLKDKIVLRIKKFESAYSQDETGEKLKNFESLAMLLVDLNYDGKAFLMSDYYFADDLLNTKKDETEEEIKAALKRKKEIKKEFPKNECGKNIMAIYVDIYGNEFREMFNLTK